MLAIDGLMAGRTSRLVKVRRLLIAALCLALQHTTIIATNHNGVTCRREYRRQALWSCATWAGRNRPPNSPHSLNPKSRASRFASS